MLTATRDYPHSGGSHHFGPPTPPRTLVSRLTSGAQLVGSLVGIPLALAGGYSTYHANFSPEAKCQSLRASIVSVLDKKTDPSTLRLLVQRDVVTFERDCGQVDADAAAAFKTLLASDKPAVAHRAAPVAKIEAVVSERPTKLENKPERVEKTEKAEKREPVKREALKRDAPVKEVSVKEAAVEPPKHLGAPPQQLVAPPPPAAEKVAAPVPVPEVEKIIEAAKPAEQAKPVETAAVQPEKTNIDATWVASVRDALRESASQPVAETTSDIAEQPMLAPVAAPAERTGALIPPADVGPAQRPSAPRPPGLIPNAN